MSQTAVGDISDAEAEHGMREEKLGHCGESGLAFVKILPQLHHIQNLVKEWQRQVRASSLRQGYQILSSFKKFIVAFF